MIRLIPVFITSVFLSINFGVLIYVNSTFLEGFFSKSQVSLIFLLASLANILIFLLVPKIINKLGKEKTNLIFISLTAVGALALTYAVSSWLVALAFIVYECFIFMTYYTLDIFVEEETDEKHTGGIRGVYSTLINMGITLGPLLMALVFVDNELRPLYFLGAALLIVPILFSIFFLFRKRPHRHRREHHNLPLKTWWHKRDVRAVSLAKLVLEIFFGFMVIYTPLYLHESLGFDWSELGIIFTVMLLPFVLFEWPAGELADRKWGEKEMMSTGFFLMGTALLVMPFLDKNYIHWLLILLLSRIGASLVEIMTESYFFKKIDVEDTDILAIFRLLRPAGIMIGSLVGAIVLNFISLEKIFFVVAIIVFFGMKEALHLRDTR